MSVQVLIDDGGTIKATLQKIEQIKRESPAKFDKIMKVFMQRVYMETLNEMNSMGIRDTGALMASTRIEKGRSTGLYDVSQNDNDSSWKIISGGGGVFNTKNKREVDYAKAVHDGYSTQSGGWVPGRPYLDMTWAKMEGQWKRDLSKYLVWIEKTWGEDQPSAAMLTWKLPLLKT